MADGTRRERPDTLSVAGNLFRFDPPALRTADGGEVALRAQTLRVLALLAENAGDAVSKERLFNEVWGETFVTDDSLVQCISEIRRALGEGGKAAIQTIPKRGYRLVADPAQELTEATAPRRSRRRLLAGVMAACLTVLAGLALYLGTGRDAALPAPPRSLAVLPFANTSGDPSQAYFSDGITEDLMVDLSALSDLRVISRSSVFIYRGNPAPTPDIAEALGADYLLEGSVRRIGDKIRLSVQLADGKDGTIVWGGRFDDDAAKIFEVQERVLTELARIIAVQLSASERARLGVRGTRNVLAYDEFLRGRQAESLSTRAGNRAAIEHYRKAVEIDPSYGLALARLANVHTNSTRVGWAADMGSSIPMAVTLAEQATRVAPKEAYTWWSLGRIAPRLGTRDGLEKGIEANGKALDLRPNYRDAYASRAFLLVSAGRLDEARTMVGKAFEGGLPVPYFYWQARGIIDLLSGDPATALGRFKVAMDQNPGDMFTRWWNIAALIEAGDVDEAAWQVDEMRALGFEGGVGTLLASTIIVDPGLRARISDDLTRAGLGD